MDPIIILIVITAYFGVLAVIARVTSRKSTTQTFFTADKKSPWYLVAFGMIGATLSGVTFISVPGAVGSGNFSYMQMVLGYFLGYVVIANVLLPVYYKMNLVSIYTYLETRFGFWAHKSGAFFFLLSRIIGASFRLFLVAVVLDEFVFSRWGIPFSATVAATVIFIWVYSFRGGIKTIVWTDTLQTLFMLISIGLAIYYLASDLDLSLSGMAEVVGESRYSDIFVWDWSAGNNFFKHFFSGAFITIVMTGLDQDMMQKNLTCRTIREAKKNVYWMSTAIIPINFMVLVLGALLYIYASTNGVITENFGDTALTKAGCYISLADPATGTFSCYPTDKLFPFLSLNYLPPIVGIIFILGLIAAAYSSADSALTSLTTSFCVDFLNFKKGEERKKTRYLVHVGFSVILFGVILAFKYLGNDAVINQLFKAAGYTYGPLLGLYAFGLFSKRKVRDRFIPIVCVLSPVISYLINLFSEELLFGYKFGFEILILNGLLTVIGLFLFSEKNK